ncbi:aminotransferase [Sulfolobus sp. SCGC AB-777_L09]|nr:aminotransferase [Sulfolobus sp. SCGC AB-777_L09]
MVKFSDYGNRITQSKLTFFLNIISKKENVISFANGLPDPSTFPHKEINEIISEIFARNPNLALQYTVTCGPNYVKDAIIKLVKERGLSDITEENICITSGSQEALFILFHLFLNPNDTVIVEKPTYIAALETLNPINVRYIGLDIKNNEYNIDKLEEELRKEGVNNVKLMYLIPSAQNPTGLTMDINTKKKIIELASEYDLYIIEDDAYGFLSFNDEYSYPLKHYDDADKVIYVGSFSKILSSGLRVGYIIANEEITKKVEGLKQNINAHTPTLNQLVAAEAIYRNVIFKNLSKIKQVYKTKRDIMLKAIENNFPENIICSKPTGGMFIFCWLENWIDTSEILMKSLEENVAFMPGKYFYFDESGSNTMRLSYSLPTYEKIFEGIEKLGKILSSLKR